MSIAVPPDGLRLVSQPQPPSAAGICGSVPVLPPSALGTPLSEGTDASATLPASVLPASPPASLPASGAPASVCTGSLPQTPLALQLPLRHTVAAFAAVQPAVPSAKPHLLSALSHTPDAQVSVAAAPLQLPSSTGVVWPGSLAMLSPFGVLPAQMAPEMLHQPPAQSPSAAHDAGAMHVPDALHKPERHTVAALAALHADAPPLS